MKKLSLLLLVLGLCSTFYISAFAGQWKRDSFGWWYDYGNGYPQSTWDWIDGNNDGRAECYYFDNNGYALVNTYSPDGYLLNRDGAWTENGQVQYKNINTPSSQLTDFQKSVMKAVLVYPVTSITSKNENYTAVISEYTYDDVAEAMYILMEKLIASSGEDRAFYEGIPNKSLYSKSLSYYVNAVDAHEIANRMGQLFSKKDSLHILNTFLNRGYPWNLVDNIYFLEEEPAISGASMPFINIIQSKCIGDKMIIDGTYEYIFSGYNHSGKTSIFQAILTPNANSFIGYSLESVSNYQIY